MSEKNEKPKDLQGWAIYLNYFIGLGILGFAVLDIIFNVTFINPITWLYPTYLLLFGFMILSANIQFDFIDKYFYFLKNHIGRGIFTIYVSTLLLDFTIGSNTLIQLVVFGGFGVVAFVGLVYLIVGLATRKKEDQQGGAYGQYIDSNNNNYSSLRGQ